MKSLSPVRLFVTPWTVAYQTPSSMGLFRQEYWSGLPFLSPGDLPNPGIEPGSPALQADALPSEPPGKLYLLADYLIIACVPAKSLQPCRILFHLMDCSHQLSSVHGILQARILEWVALPFSRGSSRPRDRTWVSRIAGRCFTI